MSSTPANPNQTLVVLWLGQMIGTIVIAAVVIAFLGSTGSPFKGIDTQWAQYALAAGLLAIIPALLYLPTFKARLDDDAAAAKRQAGTPDASRRQALQKALTIGGGLCELPQAFGLVHLLLGGETRWFLGATLVTLVLRVSYRPFIERPR